MDEWNKLGKDDHQQTIELNFLPLLTGPMVFCLFSAGFTEERVTADVTVVVFMILTASMN